MRKELSFWMLVLLFATTAISLGYVTGSHSEESYDNAKVYRLLYESGTKPYFSTNVPEKGEIPQFVGRGQIQCEGVEEESMTIGGAIVTTCIEIPPHARNISINGVAA